MEFCRHFIETFLVICFRLYTLKCLRDDVCNGLNMIHVSHEENQFAIRVENHATLSAGFSHCAAVVDGSCYMWGSNGIACTLSSTQLPAGTSEATPKCVECISCMGLEVHAVKCGKSHSLILTNNGVYVLGNVSIRYPHSLHRMNHTEFDYRILTGSLALGNINKRHYNRCSYLNSMAKIYHSLRQANITMPSMPIAYGDAEAVDYIHGVGASMVNLDMKTYSHNIDQKLCNFSTIK